MSLPLVRKHLITMKYEESDFDYAMDRLRAMYDRDVSSVDTEGEHVLIHFENGDILEVNMWSGKVWYIVDNEVVWEKGGRF